MSPETLSFGKYLIIDKIARGGMAEIFLAKLFGSEGFEKEVVIKKILPEWASDQSFLSMLIDEAKIAVLLNHANIVQIYELGKQDNDYFIAMEYVEGIDLRKLWEKMQDKGEKLPLAIALYIVSQILEALSYAHSKKNASGERINIIHRDISPHNILISYDGAIKLTDFGIAKATLKTSQTASGIHKGKFSYMSPEQANLETLTQSSDLFSVGIILYELLTGRRLFGGGSDIETLDRIRKTEIHFSSEDKRDIPEPLQKIILKALHRNPKHRFPNAATFEEELRRFAQDKQLSLKRDLMAVFLEKLFGHEMKERRVRYQSLSSLPTSASQVLKTPKKQKYKFFIILGALTFFAALGLIFFPYKRISHEKLPPSIKAIEKIPETEKPISIPTTQNSVTGNMSGHVSVMIIPWGYVSIDNKDRGESPVSKMPLKPGKHSIKVFYEPENLVLNATIDIKSNQHIRCTANFGEEKKTIQCR